MSRRWTIAVVRKMSDQGALKITKTKRVNLLSVNAQYEFKTPETPGNSTPLLVFPELLKRMSIVDSILLQQIHIRCKGSYVEAGTSYSCHTGRDAESNGDEVGP